MSEINIKLDREWAEVLLKYLKYSDVWQELHENFGKDPANQPLVSGVGGTETMAYMEFLSQLENELKK